MYKKLTTNQDQILNFVLASALKSQIVGGTLKTPVLNLG